MSEASAPSLYRAIIEAGPSDAIQIAQMLDEAEYPQSLSVSTFDVGQGLFEVSALYESAPDQGDLQALINRATHDGSGSPLRIEVVPDADWVTISQGQRGPVRAGRFLIHGSHDQGRLARNRYTIEVDADQAFGTAHHATTLGCLLVLDELAKWGRPTLVLDVGTGTGVLAIAAALAFDRAVIATDNDPVAIEIARQNAAKASVSQSVHAFVANGLSHPKLRRLTPDLIVANILARPLYDLAPDIARIIMPGGYVLLSGITESQARPVTARYVSLGFVFERRIILDGWAALLLSYPSASILFD